MQAAFTDAAERLGLTLIPQGSRVWGHGGRTLSGPVTTSSERAWLRVLQAPAGKEGGKLWSGSQQAATHLPTRIPRPRLLRSADWTQDAHVYRAELTTYEPTPVCSPTPDLTKPIPLPDAWWTQLRQATDALTATPPPHDRQPVISQDYIHRAIPRYVVDLGIDTRVQRWSLAHGDLHWANLTSPKLTILDWEGFGAAPHGFDAAHLHAYTLSVPELAARVHEAFDDILTSPDGRLAQLTVAAMLLQAADRDPVHARLATRIRHHLHHLLGSPPTDAGRSRH